MRTRTRAPGDERPLLQCASVAGRSAVRHGEARRGQRLGREEFAMPRLCGAFEGYSMQAGVLLRARDRQGLWRLAGELGLG